MLESLIKLLVIITVVIAVNVSAIGLKSLFGGTIEIIVLLFILVAACIIFVKQDMKQNSNNQTKPQ